ncbi:MAG: MnhB domain-containing protein [Campylobacterota bacterium]|nr:MnhB domain-containing protein [Campylobacterota bacterium]
MSIKTSAKMSIKKDIPLYNILIYLLTSIMTLLSLWFLAKIEPSLVSAGDMILSINSDTTKSANAVTSVVTYFRGLDTLGEITILFLAVFGVSLQIEKSKKVSDVLSCDSFLLKTGVKVLFPLIVLFGVYIIIHGHLSPGGGFQGGVIIATAFLLKYLAFGKEFDVEHKIISLMESLSGVGFILFGVISVFVLDRFLGNFLPLGSITQLFSSGTIVLIYIFVGLKVSAEITILIKYFVRGEDGK